MDPQRGQGWLCVQRYIHITASAWDPLTQLISSTWDWTLTELDLSPFWAWIGSDPSPLSYQAAMPTSKVLVEHEQGLRGRSCSRHGAHWHDGCVQATSSRKPSWHHVTAAWGPSSAPSHAAHLPDPCHCRTATWSHGRPAGCLSPTPTCDPPFQGRLPSWVTPASSWAL